MSKRLGFAEDYGIADIDAGSPISYFGFLDPSGRWVIQRQDTSSGQYRYFTGNDDYEANWIDRANLAYDYLNKVV